MTCIMAGQGTTISFPHMRDIYEYRSLQPLSQYAYYVSYRKFLPSKVWPNCQFLGVICHEVECLLSLASTLKVRDSPTNLASVTHL